MPDGSQKKISELPVAPAAHPTDLLETSQADGTGYVSRSITLAQVAAGVVAPPPAWTDITGKPATFPPTVPIAWTDVSGKPTTFPPTLPIAYTDISGKPSTFPPDPEAIDDRVAALLVAGTNITLAYNDPANTLTINSTASGGGSATLPAGSVGYGAVGNTLTGVLADFSWDATNKRLGINKAAPGAAIDVVAQANTAAITMSGYSLTGSNATGCFSIAAALNTTGQPDIFAINVTDTSNSGGNAFIIRGGPSGTASLIRTSMSGDTRVAGWCQARLNDALVTNGADYFAYYLGNGSGGNIGMFAGLSNPTFSTFGRYGSIYLNGASPGLPYYNNNGTTGWDRLVGETSTQTLTNKSLTSPTITGTPSIAGYLPLAGGTLVGALTGTTATFSGNVGAKNTVTVTGPAGTNSGVIRHDDTHVYVLPTNVGGGTILGAANANALFLSTTQFRPVTTATWDLGGGSFRWKDYYGATVDLTGNLNGTTASFTGTVSAPGAQIQMVSTQTGAVATGTTVIPFDDTIPQITEGDQYMTLAITPKSATSKLIIEITINLSSGSTGINAMSACLFQDATANALAAAYGMVQQASSLICISFRHIMTSGTTSATTFRVRAGANTAGTTTFNGQSGARSYGGTLASSIVIREVA